MRGLIKKKGQSTLEYAVVIAVVIAGLLFMGWGWFRGAYQKRLMSASDEIGGGGQFDINYTSMSSHQERKSTGNDSMNGTATGAAFSSYSTENVTMTSNATTSNLATRRP